ncbi:MAG: hypothetical protein ACK6BZ_02245, partial [Candidatus Kapaibacterium sp.]
MKLFIIPLMIVTNIVIVFSQTHEVRPLWEYTTTIASPESDTGLWMNNQPHFFLGSHWVGPRFTVNSLLHSNHFMSHWFKFFPGSSGAVSHFYQIPTGPERKALVIQTDYQSSLGFVRDQIFALQFDPEINGEQLRSGDSSGAAFGFHVRNDTLGSTNPIGMPHSNRFRLFASQLGTANSALALSQPVHSALYTQHPDFGNNQSLNRVHGYISINLRRLQTNDTLMNNDTILRIKLPIKQHNFTPIVPFIYFDSIGVSSLQEDTLPFNRGRALRLRAVPSGADSTQCIITRSMLPKGNASESDITISAFFRFKSEYDSSASIRNTFLQKFRQLPQNGQITDIGIDIRYYGKSDIGIDWVRFEVPYARNLLRSYYDTTIVAHRIRTHLSDLRNSIQTIRPSVRLLSFYGEDEPELTALLAQRHYNALLGGRWTSYMHNHNPLRHIIRPRYRWQTNLPSVTRSLWGVAPTSASVFSGSGSFMGSGFKRGWSPASQPAPYERTTGSTYEVIIHGNSTTLRDSAAYWNQFGQAPSNNWRTYHFNRPFPLSDNKHIDWFKYPDYLIAGGDHGAQPGIETASFELYAKDTTAIFSGKPWWSNVWLGTNWRFGRANNGKFWVNNDILRPQTGEEIRFQMWSGLIHGCKGFMLERLYHAPGIRQASTLALNESHGANLGALNSVIHNAVTDSIYAALGERIFDSTTTFTGGDFIAPQDSVPLLGYLEPDSIRKYLGIMPSRLYLGRLSIRHMVKTIFDMVAGNHGIGDTLMKLRLEAWVGKGYELTQKGNMTLLSKYIDLDTSKIKTRPINRNIYGTNLPLYEDTDSSFYDITLLSDTTANIDDIAYIGVQNRRTAPFVWLPQNDSLVLGRPDTVLSGLRPGKALTFLTTMEYENYVRRNKITKYSQSGAREITIPFKVRGRDAGDYPLLRIQEMGGTLDTVIGCDRPLAMKYLPGEGKIFRVRVQYPDRFTGDLAHSNQTKLVAHSIMRHDSVQNKWVEGDSVVYHAVYHKKIVGASARTGVYYRVSKPIAMASNTNALQWHNEILLSDSVEHHNRINLNDNCAFPALIVRFDSTMNTYNSFIVYGCTSSYSGDGTPFTGQHIVESIVALRRDTIINTSHGVSLDTVHSNVLSDYGTPMINASDSVNFYVYSCAQRGIIAGWKKP